MTKTETIFARELQLIHDSNIKNFVITCFDKLCPDYFWTCPCSTTGKYHPQVSLGVGGLVRHTKLAVWWGLELINALRKSPGIKDIPPDKLIDETIATLLLHDMIKNGKGLNAQGRPLESGVTGTHGVTLACKINSDILDQDADDSIKRIMAGIAGHMGIWTTDIFFRPDSKVDSTLKAFANLIHLADYCASRKVDEIYHKLETEITYDFIKESTTSIKKTEYNTGSNETEVSKSPPCPGVRHAWQIEGQFAEEGHAE